MKNLHIRDIEEAVSKNNVSSDLLGVVSVFLSAINDWPTSVLTFAEYEKEIELFIENETTKSNIEKKIKSISLNKNSWKAESLAQVLDVFQFYKEGLSLKKIIERLDV